jgi:hypothetical protein
MQEQKVAAANKLLEKEIRKKIESEEKVNLLNQQLIQHINQLKATNEELERFAYVASHDLQEPLRKIIVFSDQLAIKYNKILKEEGCNSIDRIMKAAERMQLFVRNILAFSRSSNNTGAQELTSLNNLIEHILSNLELTIEQKKATIKIGPLPVLSVVPDQFLQLFQNLIINALKFSQANKPPEIQIYADKVKGTQIAGVRDDLHNKDFHNIYIKDNGIGFEQKYADDIFVLFKRLNTYDNYEGTGLGLSICKKIVEKHDGYISVTSAEGEGSTFLVSIPAVEAGAVAAVSGA